MGQRRSDWRPRARCAGRRRGRDRGLARRRGAAARRRAEEVERVPLVGRFGSSLILGVTRTAKELEHGDREGRGAGSVAERKGGKAATSARKSWGEGARAEQGDGGGLGERGSTASPVYAISTLLVLLLQLSLPCWRASVARLGSSRASPPASSGVSAFCKPTSSPDFRVVTIVLCNARIQSPTIPRSARRRRVPQKRFRCQS